MRCKMSEMYKTHIPNSSMMILQSKIGKKEMGYEILYYIDCRKRYGAFTAFL